MANASHELRTPLTALRGDLEVALLKERTAGEYRNFLAIAYEDAKRLSKLVNHLLLFAQTASSHGGIDLQPLRIDELVMDVMQKLMLSYPDRNIDFRFSGNIPDESHLTVNGNDNLLQVAFTNIIDNALKYSDKAPVNILVESAEAVHVEVLDHGIGISLQDLENIFEPFYRSKRSSVVVGFGIGLSLSRQIIELHKGTIDLQSKVNEGTRVRVTLPLFF